MNVSFSPALRMSQASLPQLTASSLKPAFSGKPYIAGDLEFDVYNMTPCAVGQKEGVDTTALFKQYAPQVEGIVQNLWANKNNPKVNLGWLSLEHQPEVVKAIDTYTQSVKGRFDDVVILGIGGSALGTRAMFEALLPANWNQLPKEQRGGYPRYHILDNIDPDHLSEVLAPIDLKKSLVNVVSKSGSTAEPMAQFLMLRDALAKTVGGANVKHHMVFTTDPKEGVLRQIADKEGIMTFPIPPTTGGRFCIFTAVGMLPAALVGLPVSEMLAGVGKMNESLRNADIFKNPAAQAAVLEYDAYKRRGKNVTVLMPYSAKLNAMGDWYVQLWSESLGKEHDLNGQQVHTGQTPVKSVGVTDQHSHMQLYKAGPFDKIVNFIRLKTFKNQLPIPAIYQEHKALNYLGNKTVSQLIQSEFEGSRASMNAHNRPNTTLTLPQLDANRFAQMLQFYMFKTAVMGAMLNVNTYDQPCVELGKQFTYGMMGRPGFEKQLAMFKQHSGQVV